MVSKHLIITVLHITPKHQQRINFIAVIVKVMIIFHGLCNDHLSSSLLYYASVKSVIVFGCCGKGWEKLIPVKQVCYAPEGWARGHSCGLSTPREHASVNSHLNKNRGHSDVQVLSVFFQRRALPEVVCSPYV